MNMNVFGERIKQLRGKQSIDELLSKLNEKYDTKISKSMISRYENGQADPKIGTVKIFADYFNVSVDYLMGIEQDDAVKTSTPLVELNSKDERDIQKKLQEMIDGLNNKDGYAAFDGQSLDDLEDEDRELLIASLENSLRLAKRIAKQKFTPKKYRK